MFSPGRSGISAPRIASHRVNTSSDNRRDPVAPRVLISDALSPAAIAIFKERGVETDFQPDLGKDKDKLAERHRRVRRPCHSLGDEGHRQTSRTRGQVESDRPRRDRRRQCRYSRRHREGDYRDEYAVRQFHHHRRTCDRDDVRARPADSPGRCLDPGRQMGKEPLHGGRDHRQGAGPHRLRQYRLDRRRARDRLAYARHRL